MKINNLKNNRGFTLIEMIVSLAIFALMTALLLAKYGTFNQGVLLTNLAYDVALSIRNAQSYGLNVRSSARSSNDFQRPYGVHFTTNIPTEFIFFVDSVEDNQYSGIEEDITKTTIQKGSKISGLCVDTNCAINNLYIIFKRPDPDAIIRGNNALGNLGKITVQASDGTKRVIEIRSTGQISVVPLK